MTTKKIVVDSCVFSKLFLQEPDRAMAVTLMKTLANRNVTMLVPQLFFYEVMAVATYAKYDLNKLITLLDAYKKANLTLLEPNTEMLTTAFAMTDDGHPKSGYPSFYDAIYHAMALCLNCHFITTDKRHYEKTKHLGAIILLQDWESIFI